MLPENKDTRSALFECSGKRGAYPQVFILEKDGKYTNVGDFDEIQSLNDTDTLPPDVLAANPEVCGIRSRGFVKVSARPYVPRFIALLAAISHARSDSHVQEGLPGVHKGLGRLGGRAGKPR